VDGWAGTADWTIPLANRWELSGEFIVAAASVALEAALAEALSLPVPSVIYSDISGL